jgi:hypothetical protein
MSDLVKFAGRFVIRPDKEGGMILGIKASNVTALKPGFVYEIQDIDGDLLLVEVGESCIGDCPPCEPKREGTLLSWAHTADTLIQDCGKWLIATLEEWREAVRTKQT